MLLFTWLDTVEFTPINQAVIAGRNVTLKCSSESRDGSQWKYKQDARFEETSLTYNQNITNSNGRIRLNTTINGQYDLHIANSDRSDAGIYICIAVGKSTAGNGSSITQRYEAQLVILCKC